VTGPILPRVTAGRRENAATATAAMRLTGPRREVLAALEACGPADAEAVATCWRSRQAADAGHLPDSLPTMVSKLLWKLEALGWVEPVDQGFAITADGVAALSDDPTG
jgi:hypothetical protein